MPLFKIKKILNTPISLTKPLVSVSTMVAVLIAVFVLAGAVYAVKNLTISPTDGGNVILNPGSGKVGVNTASPGDYALDVDGILNATAIYQNGTPFVSSGGGSIPDKTIAAFYLGADTCPNGWILADGANGTPDLRGIFIRGAGTSGSYTKATGAAYSATYGTYSADMFQGHWHKVVDTVGNYFGRDAGSETSNYFNNQGNNTTVTKLHGGTVESDASNGTPRIGAETAPANFALTYCMKTNGDSSDSNDLFGETAGTISPANPAHQLSIEGDIYSDGFGRVNCPTGMIPVPPSPADGMDGFCVDKYEAKKDANNKEVSQAAGTPWVSIKQYEARAECIRAGKHLITEQEWLAIAHNVEQVTWNRSGGSLFNQMSDGHSDNVPPNLLAASTDDDPCYGTDNTGSCGLTTWNAQRRTYKLSNGEYIWDFGGNAEELIDGVTSSGYPLVNTWSGWTACNGYTCGDTLTTNDQRYGSNTTDTRSIVRSGNYSYGVNCGAFTLQLNLSPSSTSLAGGFRCAK